VQNKLQDVSAHNYKIVSRKAVNYLQTLTRTVDEKKYEEEVLLKGI
jgi:hypothetical protein